MFVDEVYVTCRAGSGGRGCCSFRREKFVPRGGPDGGDGGHGGSVYFVCDPSLNDLNYFRFNPEQRAKRGAHGQGALKRGKDGADLDLPVPAGTQIFEDSIMVAELMPDTPRYRAVHGGRGGFGNAHFKSSVRRAPRYAEEGQPGQEKRLKLQLKIIADCGIVGLPNAGKSTLISVVSSAHPKIADYPFTTLEPNLGVVTGKDYQSFVLADIPGLIPGAHLGAGLGNRFLRHIERTKLLLYLIDVSESSERDPYQDYQTLRAEIGSFSQELLRRPSIVAASKIDLLGDPRRLDAFRRRLRRECEVRVFPISAVTRKGVTALLSVLFKEIQDLRGGKAGAHD